MLASYREYAQSLLAAGVATVQKDSDSFYYRLDLPKFLELVQHKRWNELGPIPSANRVTASTPDICLSNSAASYVALVAFVQNQNDAVRWPTRSSHW